MADNNPSSILKSLYWNERTSRLNNGINISASTTSFAPCGSSVTDPSPKSNVRQSVWSFQSMRAGSSVNQAPGSPSQMKIDSWIKEKLSAMKLQKKSSSKRKKSNFLKRCYCKICPLKCNAFFLGLTIGSLFAGISLAVLLTMWLDTSSTSTVTSTISTTGTTTTVTTSTTSTTTTVTTSTTSTTTTVTTSTTSTTTTVTTSTTSITTTVTTSTTSTTTTVTTSTTSTTRTTTSTTSTITTTTSTTSTTTTTTTSTTSTTITTTPTTSTTTTTTTSTTSTTTTTAQASAVAQSSPTSFCGCSSFTLSLTNILFGTSGTTYEWQSSPVGQNIWSNINTPSTVSSLYMASQTDSTDYQCEIIVLYPTPLNLTSTIVTVMTTTNISYCQTILDDCTCCGDDINNFILIGELGTQINDLGTGCAANSYDNRTQESVTLYESTSYIAEASTQYTGGGEQLAIWIDFNDNFQFESWEQVAYQPLSLTYNTNVLVSIPSSGLGATIGVHRMRATLAYANVPNPCGTSSQYGETHDYTVDILSPTG